ncbi:MAG: septum site-determining protein MinD [Clostridia bacterium]|nr:septum site-determining protein MinD [Clostridia bacterium]
MGEALAIVSGKGGVGKTTIAANLGTALALLGKKVVVLDTDVGLRNLDVALGMENKIVYDMVDVLEGVCRIRQALIKDKRFEGLYLMSSSQMRDKNTISPTQMKVLCSKLKEKYDYVIIDAPPGIEIGYQNAIAGADAVLLVTTPEIATIRDADKVLKDVQSKGISRTMLIINKNRSDLIIKGILPGIDQIIHTLKTDIIGIVPNDDNVFISMNCGVPIASKVDSTFNKVFSEMASRIAGEQIPLFNKATGE